MAGKPSPKMAAEAMKLALSHGLPRGASLKVTLSPYQRFVLKRPERIQTHAVCPE